MKKLSPKVFELRLALISMSLSEEEVCVHHDELVKLGLWYSRRGLFDQMAGNHLHLGDKWGKYVIYNRLP